MTRKRQKANDPATPTTTTPVHTHHDVAAGYVRISSCCLLLLLLLLFDLRTKRRELPATTWTKQEIRNEQRWRRRRRRELEPFRSVSVSHTHTHTPTANCIFIFHWPSLLPYSCARKWNNNCEIRHLLTSTWRGELWVGFYWKCWMKKSELARARAFELIIPFNPPTHPHACNKLFAVLADAQVSKFSSRHNIRKKNNNRNTNTISPWRHDRSK